MAAKSRRATGTGRRKVRRQLALVRRPPNTRPKLKPLAPKALKIASALLRLGPSVKVVVMSESAAGTVNAPAAPLRERGAVSRRPAGIRPPASGAGGENEGAGMQT